MLEILTAFCMQLLVTVGVIVVFGLLVSLLNRFFYAGFGRGSITVAYLTGWLGVPIHELSHALMCLVFGHRIVEIRLFQIADSDGTLGYVNHSYNPRNLWQRVGNFFIGIAPILCISALLALFARLLIPATLQEMTDIIGGIHVADGVFEMGRAILLSVGAFFGGAATWQWWVFLLIGLFLTPHMTLSGADIRGAASGFFTLAILLLVTDIVLFFVSGGALDALTQGALWAGGYLIALFLLALILFLPGLVVSLLVRAFWR